jgi:hypothetical protein
MPISYPNTGGGPASTTKVYRALLTQSGTDDPVATVLENSLGGDVVWTRDTTGFYFGTLAGAFPIDKTLANIRDNNNGGNGGDFDFLIYRSVVDDPNSMIVDTLGVVLTDNSVNRGDSLLTNTAVEILVYP